MSENSEAQIPYLSKVYLEDRRNSPTSPPTLVKLREIRRMQLPQSASFEQAETTHMESPGRRREFLDTFYEDTDFEIEMNRIPLSETEMVILAAVDEKTDALAMRIEEYDGYTHVATHVFDVKNVRYLPSDLEPDQPKTATMTFKAASTVTTTAPNP